MTQLKVRGFKTSLGVLAATLGSAIGLGNIWKFPALLGENGGAGFLLVYLMASFILGLPLMIAENALGRNAQGGILKAFTAHKKSSIPWGITTITAFGAALFLIAFYTDVAGWVLIYFVKSISGTLPNTANPELVKETFAAAISTPYIAITGQITIIAMVGFILFLGVQKGIERITKILLPLLTISLIFLAIKGLFLEGAKEGLEFLFMPDFSKITSETILVAVGLAFFKLSLGSGAMVTYGSYFPKEQNIPFTAVRIMFADLFISIIAGIAIFPAVFTFGFTPTDGPSLLFITIPSVFSAMPYGSILISLFFLLSIFAAIGAMLSILEVIISVFIDYGFSRNTALCNTIGIVLFFGILATLSLTPILSHVTIFGKNIFDLFDFLSSNILMLVTGLLTTLYIGWFTPVSKSIINEVSNQNTLNSPKIISVWFFLIRYVVPVLLLTTLFNGLNLWQVIISLL